MISCNEIYLIEKYEISCMLQVIFSYFTFLFIIIVRFIIFKIIYIWFIKYLKFLFTSLSIFSSKDLVSEWFHSFNHFLYVLFIFIWYLGAVWLFTPWRWELEFSSSLSKIDIEYHERNGWHWIYESLSFLDKRCRVSWMRWFKLENQL